MSEQARNVVAREIHRSCDWNNDLAYAYGDADAILAALADAGFEVVERTLLRRLAADAEAYFVTTMPPRGTLTTRKERESFLRQEARR